MNKESAKHTHVIEKIVIIAGLKVPVKIELEKEYNIKKEKVTS